MAATKIPAGPVNLHKSMKMGASLKEATEKATKPASAPKKR
ncbi:MAG: hypothetical protein ACOY4R_27720 [Pseudomonadota bacterium]